MKASVDRRKEWCWNISTTTHIPGILEVLCSSPDVTISINFVQVNWRGMSRTQCPLPLLPRWLSSIIVCLNWCWLKHFSSSKAVGRMILGMEQSFPTNFCGIRGIETFEHVPKRRSRKCIGLSLSVLLSVDPRSWTHINWGSEKFQVASLWEGNFWSHQSWGQSYHCPQRRCAMRSGYRNS